jgi:hypothetical protein
MVIELSGIFGTIIEMNKPRDVHKSDYLQHELIR